MVINPKISTNGNKTFTESFRWREPIDLTNETHTSLEIASDGAVDFEIAETHYVFSLFTNKTDGSSLLADELYNQISTLSSSEIERMKYSFDYLQMVEAYDFCNKIDNGIIDEVWVYAMPFLGMYESVMTGNEAFWINGPTFSSTCTEKLSIMGLNYERGVAEALHSFGHRTENVILKMHGSQSIVSCNSSNANEFMSYDEKCAGLAAVGNIYFPPNGITDYDYGNMSYVLSNAY